MGPNLLIVYADQWRAQACGYAGNRDVKTPHLDRFAAEALNCRLAVSGTPVCTPARASLLTGLYPHRHGLFLNDAPLNPGLPSLGKVFAAAGYRTAWVGKWHIDGHGRYAYIPPERRQGFQYFKALECTHDYNHSRYYADDDETLRFWQGYDAFAQTDDLIRWMEDDANRPFCAALSWGPPHNPYQTAPERFRALYDPQALELPPNVPDFIKADARRNLAGYYAHCSALDHAFGRLMTALGRAGLSENTLVLFASDHGDFVGAHGLHDKQGPWDEAIRVPFLLRAPGRLNPGVSDILIDHPDILPTLCALAGLEAPAGIQGRDLSPHLRAGTTPPDDCALLAAYHTFGNWPNQPRCHPEIPALFHAREYRGLRTRQYTYLEDLRGPWLLYDNQADPHQLRNRIDDPGHRAQREALAAQLRRRREALGDEFLPGAEYVRRWNYQVDASGTIPITDWVG